MRLLSPLVFLALVGCMTPKDKAHLATLELEIQSLNQRVTALESRTTTRPPQAEPPAVDVAREQAAAELLRDANDRYSEGDIAAAKALLQDLTTNYGDTRAVRSAARLQEEIGVIGTKVSPLNAEKWFQGQADITDGVVLVVAFEVWCPHCKREMPVLSEHYPQFQALGVREVVGLTRITKSATEGQVAEWVAEKGIAFPVAKEDGRTAEELGIRGIPAAAMLRDGEVIWRGHPARLSDELVTALING